MRAYAKINLGLQILKKRDDDYHDIETVFHLIDLYDEIHFEAHEGDILLECDHPEVPKNSSNLCCQAADALRQRIGKRFGVKIILKKRIPIGAGLGGGSSDAGAVLRGLPKFWNIAVDEQTLHEIALSLGSDVPYFLRSETAVATGRGEILEYFDFALPHWIVVAYPKIPISTAWAYRNFKFNEYLKRENLKQLLLENISELRVWVNKFRNDFEPLIFRTHEEVMRVKESLYVSGADFALMAGSGSAVFGLFQKKSYAEEIAYILQKRYPVFLTKPNFRPKDEAL